MRPLEAVCKRFGVPPGAAALQFCLRGPGAAVVVAGADTPAQVEENVGLVVANAPDELWPALTSVGS